MNFDLLHPREQIVSIMKRIYVGEMTTLSGGNLSVLDDHGDLWITPAGVDKGRLTPGDVVCVRSDGTIEGPHRPSSEYPFHRAIYERRPDLRAVVHCHPPALVAYSISGETPDTRIIPQANRVCGPIRYAPYAVPGSEALGQNIADTFAQGVDIVMLENHGVASGGASLLEAYQRMETLDFCARTLINARGVGAYRTLSDAQLAQFTRRRYILPEFEVGYHTSEERQERQQIVEIVHRACDRHLMISTEGVVSARLGEDTFLITPTGADRRSLEIQDIVLVQEGQREQGKMPSRSVNLHREIYRMHPEIGSIITAQSPSAVAYAVTPATFDSRTIPESYILLRDVPCVSFDKLYGKPKEVAEAITERSPVLLIENDCVLTTGANVLKAFDRLEVLEYTARALLSVPVLGNFIAIDEGRIREIEKKFLDG
ncbi:MAG: class II aldolase/adducin family protein [Chloroflexota bacterium]|nr:class II aldolase/adducin family protein [Chloroflexota bacterium]